jgi:hypothetical protein
MSGIAAASALGNNASSTVTSALSNVKNVISASLPSFLVKNAAQKCNWKHSVFID